MLDKRATDNTHITNDLRSPRISWSVLTMGAGVIASIVLNYAAYDTRITVLERSKIVEEKTVATLVTSVDDLRKSIHHLELRLRVSEISDVNTAAQMSRLSDQMDRVSEKVSQLEKKGN